MDEQDADENEAGAGEVTAGPGDGCQAVLRTTETVRGAQGGQGPSCRATCSHPFISLPWLKSITLKNPLTPTLSSR